MAGKFVANVWLGRGEAPFRGKYLLKCVHTHGEGAHVDMEDMGGITVDGECVLQNLIPTVW